MQDDALCGHGPRVIGQSSLVEGRCIIVSRLFFWSACDMDRSSETSLSTTTSDRHELRCFIVKIFTMSCPGVRALVMKRQSLMSKQATWDELYVVGYCMS